MAGLPIDRVHFGYWFDQSHESAVGAIITVKSGTANLVIALLTVVVTVGGAAWWELMSFLLFSIGFGRSTHHYPAVAQQVMVMLKNVVSPGAFLLDMLKLLYHDRRSPHASLYLLVCISTTSSLGILIAGIFASLVVSTDNINVLADGRYCGTMSEANRKWGGVDSIRRQQYNSAWQYSQACYRNASISLPGCNSFASTSLPPPRQVDALQPFPEMHIKNDTSFTLDSGYISSRSHLGINSLKQDEVTYRQWKSCAVLAGDDYQTISDSSDLNWTYASEGDSQYAGPIYVWDFGAYDSTTGRAYGTTLAKPRTALLSDKSYNAFPFTWYDAPDYFLGQPVGIWEAKLELRPEKADAFLLGIAANDVTYMDPVEDPLFAAHRAVNKDIIVKEGDIFEDFFQADSMMGWVAYQEKYQFWFGSDTCTAFRGLYPAIEEAKTLAKTPLQLAIFSDISNRSVSLQSVEVIVPQSLLVNSMQSGGLSTNLPPDQWKHEVTAWFNFLLATLQAGVAYYAMGDDVGFKDVDYRLHLPANEAEAALCLMQKMKAPIGVSNISVVGLCTIVGISGFLFCLDLLLLPLLRVLCYRDVFKSATLRRWDQYAALHLQRKLYEARGIGEWDRRARSSPRYVGARDVLPSLCAESLAERHDVDPLAYGDGLAFSGSAGRNRSDMPSDSEARTKSQAESADGTSFQASLSGSRKAPKDFVSTSSSSSSSSAVSERLE